MSQLLNTTAVGRKTGDDASEIMQAYVATGPQMAQNHTLGQAPAGTKPKGTGAGDHLIEPR
jgi:hypothetical protein